MIGFTEQVITDEYMNAIKKGSFARVFFLHFLTKRMRAGTFIQTENYDITRDYYLRIPQKQLIDKKGNI